MAPGLAPLRCFRPLLFFSFARAAISAGGGPVGAVNAAIASPAVVTAAPAATAASATSFSAGIFGSERSGSESSGSESSGSFGSESSSGTARNGAGGDATGAGGDATGAGGDATGAAGDATGAAGDATVAGVSAATGGVSFVESGATAFFPSDVRSSRGKISACTTTRCPVGADPIALSASLTDCEESSARRMASSVALPRVRSALLAGSTPTATSRSAAAAA